MIKLAALSVKTECLNEYQKSFIDAIQELLSQISENSLNDSSYVKYNHESSIVEIYLEHLESNEIPILILVHRDMIEISCSSFQYYLGSHRGALFHGLDQKGFIEKALEFVRDCLKGNFIIVTHAIKEKVIKSEILWEKNKYPSLQMNYRMISFFIKNRKAYKNTIVPKNFLNEKNDKSIS